MIEIGTAPPVMVGIAVLLIALAWSIWRAGPELREWHRLVHPPPQVPGKPTPLIEGKDQAA